jgi:hypothetical protein
MISILDKWIKHAHYRKIFAVTKGLFLGEMLVFVKEEGSNYCFLSLPTCINRKIPKEKFDFGIENGILDFVETSPKDVYKVTVKQYQKNESTN